MCPMRACERHENKLTAPRGRSRGMERTNTVATFNRQGRHVFGRNKKNGTWVTPTKRARSRDRFVVPMSPELQGILVLKCAKMETGLTVRISVFTTASSAMPARWRFAPVRRGVSSQAGRLVFLFELYSLLSLLWSCGADVECGASNKIPIKNKKSRWKRAR